LLPLPRLQDSEIDFDRLESTADDIKQQQDGARAMRGAVGGGIDTHNVPQSSSSRVSQMVEVHRKRNIEREGDRERERSGQRESVRESKKKREREREREKEGERKRQNERARQRELARERELGLDCRRACTKQCAVTCAVIIIHTCCNTVQDNTMRRRIPKHYTLHPTPYSSLYTLHLIPYTLQPTPYTLHPTP